MIIKCTADLNDQIYQDSLVLRKEVFIQEQHVPIELEIDQDEANCQYYVGYDEHTDQPIATARVLKETPTKWHIQRVAVQQNYRHQGLASQVMRLIEQHAQVQGIKTLVLNAQDQAQDFYINLGYHVEGDQFLDAGIKHHKMVKTV